MAYNLGFVAIAVLVLNVIFAVLEARFPIKGMKG